MERGEVAVGMVEVVGVWGLGCGIFGIGVRDLGDKVAGFWGNFRDNDVGFAGFRNYLYLCRL